MLRNIRRVVWRSGVQYSIPRSSLLYQQSAMPGLAARAMSSEHVSVDVVQGALKGKKEKTRFGSEYYSFKGIPYAKPPVGPLRFKAPQPPEPWIGVRDALKEGPNSPHMDVFFQKFRGEDNCLFLNVFTPKLDVSSPTPVMVFLHGGGYTIGSGDSDIYGPEFLVNEGVVLVTLNYRLAVFGFLSVEGADVSSNAGLKDQVAALRWVQQNIAKFGGDPNNVTLFAESAGAACGHMHLMSPMSKGLFHRTIFQSGSALSTWSFSDSNEEKAYHLGELLGCKTQDPQELVSFLREVPAEKIIEMQRHLLTARDKKHVTFPFRPTLEQNVKYGDEVFLPGRPLDLIRTGQFQHLPCIFGLNSQEGIIALKDLMAKPTALTKISVDHMRLVPQDLALEESPLSHKVADKVRKFFFGDRGISKATIPEYINLQSDLIINLGMHASVKEHLVRSSSPLYCYRFAFDGDYNLFKRLMGGDYIKGACHVDEICYLFSMAMLDSDLSSDTPEMITVSRMAKMWTNFAKTGNPSPGPQLEWTPMAPDRPCHLEIDTQLSMKPGFVEQERSFFWDQVYAEHSPQTWSKL